MATPASVPFSEVDIRNELNTRPHRAAGFEAEDRALAELATELAVNPRNMLQKLVETALTLCRADTAGISLLESHDDGMLFRWEALAGVYADRRNNTMPRDASPCGVCIDQNSTQLMYLADRCFPALYTIPRFVETLLIPFHHHGRPIGTVWVVTHSLDRKFDREDERVIRTLAAFASAGWQLWKALEDRDEFLAVMGHEIRNPLAAIRSALRAMQHPDIAVAEQVRSLSIVDGQVADLTRMVDDLLDVSRTLKGKLELRRQSVELRKVVDHAIDTSRVPIESRGHQLTVSFPQEPLFLEADPVRLGQLITNLLDNAAKYTPNGGRIWLEVVVEQEQVKFSVRDNGIGISSGEIDTIFEPFRQIQGKKKPFNTGLGLGLTLVERFAHLHEGTVTASSAGLGQGSEFIVRLPLGHAAPPAGTPLAPARPPRTVARRILLVEDNAVLSYAFGLQLRLEGHDVRTAASGREALAAAAEFHPDVVLLDLGLPDMNGHEVARRLRESAPPKRPVIVALTGHAHEDFRRLSREAGCDYHLIKPADLGTLREILNMA